MRFMISLVLNLLQSTLNLSKSTTMLFIFLILSLTMFAETSGENAILSMKSIQCNANEDFVFKNFSCFAKSYSRTLSTMNAFFFFKAPVDQLFVSFKLRHSFKS